jgi:hypothetical protein
MRKVVLTSSLLGLALVAVLVASVALAHDNMAAVGRRG